MSARKTGSGVILVTQIETVSKMVSQMVHGMVSANADMILKSGEKASPFEEPSPAKTGHE
jgi:hypothetical protein